MLTRAQLRRQMRLQRRALTPAQRTRAAECLAEQFASTRLFQTSQHIACYLSHDGELDTLPLMRRAWAKHKSCYLPVLSRFPAQRLRFAPYREGDALIYNRFGILQPKLSVARCANLLMLDIILAPLVAFDGQGNRLGMGGGFYDRTCAFLERRQVWQRPRLVGLAYDFQRVAVITPEPWDVPLHAVVTGSGVYPTHRR